MPRYAAFLRGVMPVNAKMSDLKKAFEAAGFTDVKTILGSGNVVFSARAASEASLQQRAEAAMAERLGHGREGRALRHAHRHRPGRHEDRSHRPVARGS